MKTKYLILALFYTLIPIIFNEIFYKGSMTIPALHCLLSEFFIVLICMYIYFGNKNKSENLNSFRNNIIFFITFVSLLVDDFIYSGMVPSKISEKLPLLKISEIAYVIFVIGACTISIQSIRKILNFKIMTLNTFIFTIFLALDFNYIFTPFIHKTQQPETFYIISAFVYSIASSLMISTNIVGALFSKKYSENLFYQSFLLIGFSNFALRYYAGINSTVDSSFFSYTWGISISTIFSLVALDLKIMKLNDFELNSQFSFKIFAVFSSGISMLMLAVLFVIFDYFKIPPNAMKLTSLLFIFYFCWLSLNVLAISITNKFLTFLDKFNHSFNNQKADEVFLLDRINDHSVFYEFNSIKTNFNNLILEYNKLQEKNAENLKYMSIANAARYMAHDIRKPFSSVMMLLNSFDKLQKQPELLDKFKGDIKASYDNANSMLEDLLDVSRESQLEVKQNCLIELLQKSQMILKLRENYPEIIIEQNFNHESKVKVHDQKIVRIFSNILQNAVEAITEMGNSRCGKIEISSVENHDSVILKIWNSGPQIPVEHLQRIFSSTHTSGKNKGTGLGLAVVKKLLEIQNGSIYASNENRSEFRYFPSEIIIQIK